MDARTLQAERDTAITQRDAVKSSLALAQTLSEQQQTRIHALEGQLREAARQFRFYELQHLAKGPAGAEKAKTNADLAARIEDLLGRVVRTRGEGELPALRASTVFDHQRVFMAACGQTFSERNYAQACLYRRLLGEETEEFDRAYAAGDIVEMADAVIDIVVVTIGIGLSLGLPMNALWDEVLRSNMAKVGPDGMVSRRDDGKILKPEGWTPPDIVSVLREFGIRRGGEHS